MKNIQFPVKFEFKVTSLSNDFSVKDADEQYLGYVRQKMFKFIDEIQVFTNDKREQLNYTIKANKWIDFSACYKFTDANQLELGMVARKGWASLWNAKYEIFDRNNQSNYTIREKNAWVKFGDALLGEIPILSFFTGYLFNPTYLVRDLKGNIIYTMKKQPSFFGRKFEVFKNDFENKEDELLILSLMMMVILERRRG